MASAQYTFRATVSQLPIQAGSNLFVGRDEVLRRLLETARHDNAVLLYGGRQSGKTTLLLAALRHMRAVRGRVSEIAVLDVPVFVDLTTLHYDASPPALFGLLIDRLREALSIQIEGFAAPSQRAEFSLDDFVRALRAIKACCGEVDARPVFLLDEAKRILGNRFPRGFQDNLFSLLYGEFADSARCAMVFAGAQHLNEFSIDDTSPIGSRAGVVLLEVLPINAVQKWVEIALPDISHATRAELSAAVVDTTGGHAGLVAKMLAALSRFGDAVNNCSSALSESKNRLYEGSLGLFENWTLSWTSEALATIDLLGTSKTLSIPEIAANLQAKGLNRFLARRVMEELCYTGAARWHKDRVEECNQLYWQYLREFGPISQASVPSTAWSKIEETELALRQLIWQKFTASYGSKAPKVMERILGDKAWQTIMSMQERGSDKYKFSPASGRRDLMSCMYLGQLGDLMVHGDTWALFKGPYRDKREFQDRLAAIASVRTDRAHFVTVPQRELHRCTLACEDILAVVESELAAAEGRPFDG